MFDLISIGDGAIDHFFKIHDARLEKNRGEKKLCLNFGEKLPVEQYYQTLGGNNANNAVGAARLNLKVAAYLNIGADLAGKYILEILKKERIDTRYVITHEGMDSNVSALISFQGERTILVYHQMWAYKLPDLEKSRWIYLSSLAKSFLETHFLSQVENYLERVGSSLVFNPGNFELEHGIKRFPRLLSLTKLLIVNKEEAEMILRIEKGKKMDMKKLLKGLAELGPQMVTITNGQEGSYNFDGKNFWKMDIFPAQVVDMTGAGDGFATGVLAGLFYGKDLEEAMRWGSANGASVVEEIGPQKGLLTYDKMQERLKKHSKIIARKLS